MRKEKALISLLRGIVELLEEESSCNPQFAQKVDALLAELPARMSGLKREAKAVNPKDQVLPDIYAEWNSRGESEFKFWLGDQPITILRALIRSQDFDPTRRTTKWRETEKLAAFIAEGLRARLARGSSFIKQPIGNEPGAIDR